MVKLFNTDFHHGRFFISLLPNMLRFWEESSRKVTKNFKTLQTSSLASSVNIQLIRIQTRCRSSQPSYERNFPSRLVSYHFPSSRSPSRRGQGPSTCSRASRRRCRSVLDHPWSLQLQRKEMSLLRVWIMGGSTNLLISPGSRRDGCLVTQWARKARRLLISHKRESHEQTNRHGTDASCLPFRSVKSGCC